MGNIIKFSDLSKPLKFSVVLSWVSGIIVVLWVSIAIITVIGVMLYK